MVRGSGRYLGTVGFLAALLVGASGIAAVLPTANREPYPVNDRYVLDESFAPAAVTITELIATSDLVAVVTPTGEHLEVWNALGNLVSSRFPARVDRVFKGNVRLGETVLLFAPGGVVRDPFPATESRQPADAGTTLREEYADYPWFAGGRRELVFLRYLEPDDPRYEPFFYMHGRNGRYSIRGGEIRPIYPPALELDDPGGVRAEMTGRSLAWLQRRVAEAWRDLADTLLGQGFDDVTLRRLLRSATRGLR